MNGRRSVLVGVAVLACALFSVPPARGGESQPLQEVSPAVAEKPQDSLVLFDIGAPETIAAMRGHRLTVGGKPPSEGEISPSGWKTQCEWAMPTPRAGDYVVTLFLFSGENRPGKFGYSSGATKRESDEFRRKGRDGGCLMAFRITAPAGQPQTKMFLSGDGIALRRVDISPVTHPIDNPDGVIRQLAESSYRTVLRAAKEPEKTPSCMVLAPRRGVEARLARQLADALKLRLAEEPGLTESFPQNPALKIAGPDTNLILLSAGTGGPMVKAMRRAGLIAENFAIPGAGGYVIRTVPRPFTGKANVIVLSGGDEAGLAKAVQAFQPTAEAKTGDLVWDRFLEDSPGERWAKLRPAIYRYADDDPYWNDQSALLKQRFGGVSGLSPGRAYIHATGIIGNAYWLTGNPRFAELFKQRMVKMEDDGIYGWVGQDGEDSHMELYGLMRGWSRVEESPMFTTEDRLRITNFLLHHCVLGNEGYLRAYAGHGLYSGPLSEYTGPVRMRHNHQMILGCGLTQAYLYFSRFYGLGCADAWKSWCDNLVENATAWGHGPENSVNYEPMTFRETADILHYQGLSAAGRAETRSWPAAAIRFMSVRDSFGLPACYGDCWDATDYGTLDSARWDFFGILRDDFDWALGQAVIDRVILGYRYIDPISPAAGELFAYLHGSTEVGGVLPPPPPAAAMQLQQLIGLRALPMGEGYWRYMTGQVGNEEFWSRHRKPEAIPYPKTADKVVYRSGWGIQDEYLLLETLGWADHSHMSLGAVAHYCQGGRLWITDFGYSNTGPESCSTLEVKRDGIPGWGDFDGRVRRFGEFRTGPQMFEVIKLDQQPPAPNQSGAGAFRVVCRAKDLAGATWLRSVSGGDNRGLRIEDTLTAQEPGNYQIVFRLRLLGRLEGEKGKWQVFQKGAALPIALDFKDGDSAAAADAVPDTVAACKGSYPWYPFLEGAGKPDDPARGAPRTIEWKRTVQLRSGQSTILSATLGPSEETNQ